MTKNMLFTDLQAAKDLNLDISKVHPLDFLSVWYLIKLSIPSRPCPIYASIILRIIGVL